MSVKYPKYTNEVGYLTITTYVGTMTVGHWYGRLRWFNPGDERERENKQSCDVEGILTQEWADRLNSDDYWDIGYHVGEECGRFYSREEMIGQAIKTIKAEAPHVKVLLDCDWYTLSPSEVFSVSSPKLERLGNKLWMAWCDTINIIDKEKEDRIAEQWRKLFINLGFSS